MPDRDAYDPTRTLFYLRSARACMTDPGAVGLGCNVQNPAAFAFSIANKDTSFDPTGDASNRLVSTLKTSPIDPRTSGFTGTVGGVLPAQGTLLDRTAVYRGAFDSSLPTLWTDSWTVLAIAGLL